MITLDIASVLSVISLMLGSIAAVAAVVAVRCTHQLQARCLAVETSLESVRREMQSLASISVRTGRRVQRIENDYSGVADRVDQVELRGPTQSFEQAIDSARRGVDPVTLSQQFGLSRGEADLVTRMHGRRKTA